MILWADDCWLHCTDENGENEQSKDPQGYAVSKWKDVSDSKLCTSPFKIRNKKKVEVGEEKNK